MVLYVSLSMAADANVQSVPSDLLSLEENNLIVTIVGNKRQVSDIYLATQDDMVIASHQ